MSNTGNGHITLEYILKTKKSVIYTLELLKSLLFFVKIESSAKFKNWLL